MNNYTLTHLNNDELLRDLTAIVARDRVTTAVLLAHIGEVDARELYKAAGYSSMFVYCTDELHMSEDVAYKRIRAARTARRLPVLFGALAEGRLHLTGVSLLASHLTPENAHELVEAATHMRQSDIESLLIHRFGARELPAASRCVPATTCERGQLAARPVVDRGTVSTSAPEESSAAVDQESEAPANMFDEGAPGHLDGVPGHHEDPAPPPPPEHFRLHFTIPKSSHEKLKYAQSLLSHSVPSGDVSEVFDRALDALISELEKRKIGGVTRQAKRRLVDAARVDDQTAAPRPNHRHIPSQVRRAVWERDGGQCTFVGARGARCKETRFLEFDHVEPVARGGTATVETIRLRCRAHNQYEAERMFGASFMKRKRHEARLARTEARTQAEVTRPEDVGSRETRAPANGVGP